MAESENSAIDCHNKSWTETRSAVGCPPFSHQALNNIKVQQVIRIVEGRCVMAVTDWRSTAFDANPRIRRGRSPDRHSPSNPLWRTIARWIFPITIMIAVSLFGFSGCQRRHRLCVLWLSPFHLLPYNSRGSRSALAHAPLIIQDRIHLTR